MLVLLFPFLTCVFSERRCPMESYLILLPMHLSLRHLLNSSRKCQLFALARGLDIHRIATLQATGHLAALFCEHKLASMRVSTTFFAAAEHVELLEELHTKTTASLSAPRPVTAQGELSILLLTLDI